ncbi:zn-finger domain-containing protein [Gigaspora margarita]|uniref:Zn-finger domain-containing protein n=1 Tax=Gigaspora margarita TaxID=4874 RepID=A0A8H3XJC6_GIGMA|nr:zn-finger domain-containing protein [Gigaspora margarita]
MHHLDLGLFNYQITFTYNLLKELHGTLILDELDNKLANIPRFPELKIFKNRIQSLFRIIANEYRNLIKVIIFVLDNLDISEALNKKLLNLYEVWNNIEYGTLNGFSTETYESLHKGFVKALYYLTNKQNIEIQIMKMVQRQDIVTKLSSSKSKNIKTISSNKFTYLIWTFSLNNAQEFINQQLKDYNSSSKIYFGLENFLENLTIYFNSTNQINLDNLKLENNNEALTHNLALIQWYDFKSQKNLYYYGCSKLQLTELFNVIDIEAIRNQVHVISCFDKTNEYLVNKNIF